MKKISFLLLMLTEAVFHPEPDITLGLPRAPPCVCQHAVFRRVALTLPLHVGAKDLHPPYRSKADFLRKNGKKEAVTSGGVVRLNRNRKRNKQNDGNDISKTAEWYHTTAGDTAERQ